MVATRLKYNLTQGTHILDLAKDLSAYHRRMHRQKKIYTVYGGFIRNNAGTSAKFNVAPLTWQSKAAVNRAFKIWRKMIHETLKDREGLKTGKWNDFKILLDNSSTSTIASSKDAADNNLSPGEWDYSTLTQPQLVPVQDAAGNPTAAGFDLDADQWEICITGVHSGAAPNYTRISAIQSWVDSRPVLPSSGEPENVININDPLSNMFDVEDNDNEKVTIIEAEGDLPPYSRTLPYGIGAGALAPVSIADNDASDNTTALGSSVHGFQALCGLVQVVVTADSGTCELFIDVESQGESF